MRGMFGGMITGGLVSGLALSALSVVSEQPVAIAPLERPILDGSDDSAASDVSPSSETEGLPASVGNLSIEEPQAPELPDDEVAFVEPENEVALESDVVIQESQATPSPDTIPLDQPQIISIEGALEAPEGDQSSNQASGAFAPVSSNAQPTAPEAPEAENNLAISTAPAAPIVAVEQEERVVTEQNTDAQVTDLSSDQETAPVSSNEDDVAEANTVSEQELEPSNVAPFTLVEPDQPPIERPSRFVLEGEERSFFADRDTGVIIRRPGSENAPVSETDAEEPNDTEELATGVNALRDYAAVAPVTADLPRLSVVLVDDGTMNAASAALAGLPFGVTIALDPAMSDVTTVLSDYRAEGFEAVVLAKLPEGAQPTDIEITFESVFSRLPETIAVLDLGEGGLHTDREITEYAMDILASEGRGYVTISNGLNMAERAATEAGVPSVLIDRLIDAEDQDARVVRRFIDNAAFRARQQGDVILVGHVRPDTISALILWGTANQDNEVAVVPLSAILNNQ